MQGDDKPSKPVLYAGVLCFVVLVLLSFYWFFVQSVFMIEQVTANLDSVAFDKGALYLLGVAIGLGALVSYMVLELWFGRAPSGRTGNIITKIAISGTVITFLLPQLVHYPLGTYLQNRGYQVCYEASHRWLFYQEIIFVKSSDVCGSLAEKKR